MHSISKKSVDKKVSLNSERDYNMSEDEERLLDKLVSKIWEYKPYSYPFLFPVEADLVPCYYSVIRNPMDLSMIKRKLRKYRYRDPWSVLDDFRLMFANARKFNSKTSCTIDYLNTLVEFFEVEADKTMKLLGYCCARVEKFAPTPLVCAGGGDCTIPVNAMYFSLDEGIYCKVCVKKVVDKPPKYLQVRNSEEHLEPFVECRQCRRKLHQVCALYVEKKGSFFCEACQEDKDLSRTEDPFTAKSLPETVLGKALELRVNEMLRSGESGAGHVTVRVVSSVEKEFQVKEMMKRRYLADEGMPAILPYKEKVILTFDMVDGVEVCFFGIVVQEYGSEVEEPNCRRVYLAYLDSVRYFEPDAWRTRVYQEILLGYLEHVGKLGYLYFHLWACPPLRGDDYLFNRHPETQKKTPDVKRLIAWYKASLTKGREQGDLVSFQTLLQHVQEKEMSSVTQLPYFEGDHWPEFLEIVMAPNRKGRGRNRGQPRTEGEIWTKTLTEMKRHEEQYFVVHLNSQKKSWNLPETQDKDPLIPSELIEEGLVQWCSSKNREFSSLRRAKHSTAVMLYELHNEKYGVGKVGPDDAGEE